MTQPHSDPLDGYPAAEEIRRRIALKDVSWLREARQLAATAGDKTMYAYLTTVIAELSRARY